MKQQEIRWGDEVDVFVSPAIEADDVSSGYVVDFFDDFFVWDEVVSGEIGEDGEEIDVEDDDSVLG